MKKIAFIINPKSGTKSKESLPELIEKNLDKEKFEPKIVYTQYAGHGKELAQQLSAEGYDVVVACGGDGTVNEIASAIVHTNTALAIVPLGSGNGLGRHLGYSMSPSKALQQINEANEEHIDYAKANDRCFFCTCGTGFDALVAYQFATAGSRGFQTYVKKIMQDVLTYKPETYRITDGKDINIEHKAFLLTFANANQWGNKAYIAPHASIQDGKMDICMLSSSAILGAPALAVSLFTKTIDKSMFMDSLQARDVTLYREAESPFHIDGDPVAMPKQVRIRMVEGGLRVLVAKRF